MDETTATGLSLRLAQFVTRTPDAKVPGNALRAAARTLLDATGVMRAASTLAPEALPFIEQARESGEGPATVLGTHFNASAALAALANGSMAHALDYEDAFDAAPLHPNASLIPAVLATAQAHRPVSGRALLAAIAIGCDIACRLALCLRRPLEEGGWYPPPIIGAWGAVAGAARVLQLTPRQLLDAWSMLLLQNSCAGEIKHDGDSVIRAVREAFPAQAAVQVTQLARAGVRGFDAPLEGRDGFFRLFAGGRFDADVLFAQLGKDWYVEQLSFKPWPSCRGTHAAIECALELRASVAPAWDRVREIRIEGGEVHRMLAQPLARKQSPQTAIDAKFSLPWTVCSALVHDAVGLDSFSADALGDRAVLELAQRASFIHHPEWGRDSAVSGAVQIVMADGATLRHEVLEPRGSPARPLGDEALLAKFVDCAARARQPLAPVAAEALGRRILDLAAAPDAGEVVCA